LIASEEGMKPPAPLTARPRSPPTLAAEAAPGLHVIDLGVGRSALLDVPSGWKDQTPAPLAVMLHGSGGEAEHGLAILRPQAADAGVIVLAPASRAYTWDVLVDGFGPDVSGLDAALAWVFARYPVDSRHLALGGFSDGASYALTLGLANGDLFSHVLALSPGFVVPTPRRGQPTVFVSHGRADDVLPIDVCSRRIVPALRRSGQPVEYVELDGGHAVPREVGQAALQCLLS
jgi:phospholipase/carboxylesterase